MKSYRLFFIVLVISSSLFQCQFSRLQDDPGVVLDDSNKGILSIKIPGFYDHFYPPLQTIPTPLPSLANRGGNNQVNLSQRINPAYAANPTRIDFRLKNGDGEVINSWTITCSDQKYLMNVKKAIPAGSNYILEADLYNSFVSDTDILSKGLTKPFDVSAGGLTSVEVYCTIVNPVLADQNTLYPVLLAPSWYDLNIYNDPFLRSGGERWYAIERSAPVTTFEFIPDSQTVPLPGFYYKGEYSHSFSIYQYAIMELPGKPMKIYVPYLPDLTEDYLVVMGATASGIANSTMSWRYYAGGPADTDEPNNTYALAIVLEKDVEAQGFCIDDDYYKLTVTNPGTIQIRLQNNNSDEELASAYINFKDSSFATILNSVGIYSWMTKDFKYPLNVSAAGDYYLIISPSYSGTKYTVSWTMGS